mgnify:CR=1 FL=1
MAVVKNLLKAPESNLKTMFKSMISPFSSMLDEVIKTVASLQDSLKFSQNKINEFKPLKSKLTDITEEVEQIKGDFCKMQKSNCCIIE